MVVVVNEVLWIGRARVEMRHHKVVLTWWNLCTLYMGSFRYIFLVACDGPENLPETARRSQTRGKMADGLNLYSSVVSSLSGPIHVDGMTSIKIRS